MRAPCVSLDLMEISSTANMYLSVVLGGQKISGADIRDQNGNVFPTEVSVVCSLLIIRSTRNPSNCQYRQKLLWAFRSGQDDGG